MPKNEHRLQSVTVWVKTILGVVRDLTSCHTSLSKQRANNIGILAYIRYIVPLTDKMYAVIVGVRKGALLIQRAKLRLLPARRDAGLVIQQIEQLSNVRR